MKSNNKTLLDILPISVLDNLIQSELKGKVSIDAQMVYIRCLLGRFRTLTADLTEATFFTLEQKSLGNVKGMDGILKQLEKAGLVDLQGSNILFYNKWSKHMERGTSENNLQVIEPQLNTTMFHVEHFKADLENSQLLIDSLQMKYLISREAIIKMVALFVAEQTTFEKKYSGWADCAKHFTYWVGNSVDKIDFHPPVDSKVVSNSKILGL